MVLNVKWRQTTWGPFLFTALISPKVIASGSNSYVPRIVYVASAAHAWCDGVNLAQMEHPDPSTYKPMAAYAQAKSANILTAIELTKRASGRINAYSLCPGGELPFTLILSEPTPC
jgi:NAD(P)-dependent dehydrogenase (short-subunit alcohol dehydrogenase family)